MENVRIAALVLFAVFARMAEAQDSLDEWEASLHRVLYTPQSDKLPALEAKLWSTFSPKPGVLADRVTQGTSAGMIVTAVVYRPDPELVHWKGQLPDIVIVNGHGRTSLGGMRLLRHNVREGRCSGRDVRLDR